MREVVAIVGGIGTVADGLVDEVKRLSPWRRKTRRGNPALLVATMLEVRGANLTDLAAALPRDADRTDMRCQWIARVLGNDPIDPDAVMAPFAAEVLGRAAADRRGIVPILDPSKVSDRHRVPMPALRHGERALPFAWRVETTEGAIGFEVQKALLDAVASWMPEGVEVCPMGDRFHGTADLISPCQGRGWNDRLRLEGTLVMKDRSGGPRRRPGPRARSVIWRTSNSRRGAPRRTSASSATLATTSLGSSPCRRSPVISPRWTIPSAGGSSRQDRRRTPPVIRHVAPQRSPAPVVKQAPKLIGATGHYVTPDLDEGPIIEQEAERMTHALSADDLVAVGRDIEARVLARAVKLHVERRVMLDGRRTVVL